MKLSATCPIAVTPIGRFQARCPRRRLGKPLKDHSDTYIGCFLT